MASAKEIIVQPISSQDAHAFMRKNHYSHKSVNNSQLHFGIFLNRLLVGAMQFGPSLDKRKMVGLVRGTSWNGFMELNRLAMVDDTPKNTESRAIAVAMRLIRREYPHIQWIVSFADATQCGDGTIYRASGFVLTGIKKNNQIWQAPSGLVTTRMVVTDTTNPQRGRLLAYIADARFSRISLTDGRSKGQQAEAVRLSRITATKSSNILETGASSMKQFIAAGFLPLPGFQLRYVYFLDPTARQRLTVPEIPFSRIAELGASMYKGMRAKDSIEPTAIHAVEGGAAPTRTLQTFPIVARLQSLAGKKAVKVS